jgi:hypothetical protein
MFISVSTRTHHWSLSWTNEDAYTTHTHTAHNQHDTLTFLTNNNRKNPTSCNSRRYDVSYCIQGRPKNYTFTVKTFNKISYKHLITCKCDPYFKIYKCKANFLLLSCLWVEPQGAERCKAIQLTWSILLNLLHWTVCYFNCDECDLELYLSSSRIVNCTSQLKQIEILLSTFTRDWDELKVMLEIFPY